MTPEISRLLQGFSDATNKSSGGTHPADERRFFDFIIQAHREKAVLPEHEVSESLVEDGFTHDQASRLSSKYVFGRDLLNRMQPD